MSTVFETVGVDRVRKAPDGLKDVVALVDFNVKVGPLHPPLQFSRSYQNAQKEWRDVAICDVGISAGDYYSCKEAQVRVDRQGGYWLSVRNINVPRDVLVRVEEMARAQITAVDESTPSNRTAKTPTTSAAR
jgi:hypothetical protein